MEKTRMVSAVIAVVAMGLVAGLMLGTGMNGYTARSLPEASWVLRFQAEDHLFASVMPPIFLTRLALQIVACVFNRGASRGLFFASTILVIGVLLITTLREVPLNHLFQSWTADAVPADWAALRDRWLKNHLARIVVGAAALVCAASGLAKVR
jgi:hypothetical protein